MRDIIIVEDGLHERERLNKIFSSSGYAVSTAESAQEAEQLLSQETYRLAILDIGLGDKSGSYLFELLKRKSPVPYIVILTGNPSTHLKQRFLDDGAVSYIVKGSQSASNDSLLDLVRSLLGAVENSPQAGISLAEFVQRYVSSESRELFLDQSGQLPKCSACGSADFIISFFHKTQLPPLVEGKVLCARCSKELDPEAG